ncbi:S-layer homology domain-containing protein [Paenibacillus lemnae]|uniref:S-layer homology domain-containing protein n=1 Tax=Paenibacillus lemnae TaxID=1330551 RepID=A0A848M7H3_PAELE|nr:S-layer homology domain-containing protein [Paenibacillus lemnae]NMO96625.1 S-layer homology domain-containing protein [Paenibacillus lemnae]
MGKKTHGTVAGLLGLSMMLGNIGGVQAQYAKDISGHWAEQKIQKWLDAEYLTGYQDGSFKPNQTVTRAEFVAMINRLFGYSEQAEISYKDLAKQNWAYKDIAAAVQAGYVQGYENNTIRPNSPVTRQEAAVIVANILGVNPVDNGILGQFSDAGQVASWSKTAVTSVIENNVMQGYPNRTFAPKKLLTRAEAVMLIDTAKFKYDELKTVTYDTAGTFGPEEGQDVIEGNVIISTAGVILKNVEIKGSLTLAEGIGEGDVTIQNVKVHGDTNVQGGGANSIHLVDSVLVNVIVNKKDGSVRIVAQGSTQADNVIVQSAVKLEEIDATGVGFTDVQLAKELSVNAQVVLNGTFDDVDIAAASISVQLERGAISTLNVQESAGGTSVTLSSGSNVIKLVLDAVAKLLGTGTISTAVVNDGAQDSEFAKAPNNLEGPQKDAVKVPPAAPPVSTGGGSGGSSGGGSGETPTPPSADQVAANSVTNKIAALPAVDNLTLADEARVNDAKGAFDALTTAQQNLISGVNKSKLSQSVAKIAELKADLEEQQTPKLVIDDYVTYQVEKSGTTYKGVQVRMILSDEEKAKIQDNDVVRVTLMKDQEELATSTLNASTAEEIKGKFGNTFDEVGGYGSTLFAPNQVYPSGSWTTEWNKPLITAEDKPTGAKVEILRGGKVISIVNTTEALNETFTDGTSQSAFTWGSIIEEQTPKPMIKDYVTYAVTKEEGIYKGVQVRMILSDEEKDKLRDNDKVVVSLMKDDEVLATSTLNAEKADGIREKFENEYAGEGGYGSTLFAPNQVYPSGSWTTEWTKSLITANDKPTGVKVEILRGEIAISSVTRDEALNDTFTDDLSSTSFTWDSIIDEVFSLKPVIADYVTYAVAKEEGIYKGVQVRMILSDEEKAKIQKDDKVVVSLLKDDEVLATSTLNASTAADIRKKFENEFAGEGGYGSTLFAPNQVYPSDSWTTAWNKPLITAEDKPTGAKVEILRGGKVISIVNTTGALNETFTDGTSQSAFTWDRIIEEQTPKPEIADYVTYTVTKEESIYKGVQVRMILSEEEKVKIQDNDKVMVSLMKDGEVLATSTLKASMAEDIRGKFMNIFDGVGGYGSTLFAPNQVYPSGSWTTVWKQPLITADDKPTGVKVEILRGNQIISIVNTAGVLNETFTDGTSSTPLTWTSIFETDVVDNEIE